MIINNVVCSDTAYRKLGSPAAVGKFVSKYAHKIQDGSVVLTPAEIKEIRTLVGHFKNGEELARKLKPLTTFSVLGQEIHIPPAMMKRITRRAFRQARPGEPRSYESAESKEAADAVVQRYIETYILDTVKRAIGSI